MPSHVFATTGATGTTGVVALHCAGPSCHCSCCCHHVAIYPAICGAGICIAAHRATIQVGAIALVLVPVSIVLAFTLPRVVLVSIVMLVLNGVGDADAHHPGIGAGVHHPGVHIAIVLASVVMWVLDGVGGVRRSC